MDSLILALSNKPNEQTLKDILTFIKENPLDKVLPYLTQLFNQILSSNHVSPINLEIFFYCIDIFFTFPLEGENIQKFTLDKIFKSTHVLYSQIESSNLTNSFYNHYYPNTIVIEYIIGDAIDYLYKDEEGNYCWTEGEISRIDGVLQTYEIKLKITNQRQSEDFDSYRIQPYKTFTKEDFNWKRKLLLGDVVDIIDDKDYWYKTTVQKITSSTLTLGPRLCEIKSNFPLANFMKFDNYGINTIKIKPRDTFSFDIHYPSLVPIIEIENELFNLYSMHIPFNNKHYVIPKKVRDIFQKYSFDYCDIGSYFMKKLDESLSSANSTLLNEKESFEHFKMMCNILYELYSFLHLSFSRDFIPKFITKAQKYLLYLSKAEVFDYTFQSIEEVIVQLKEISKMGYYHYEINVHFYDFEINFALNCMNDNKNIKKKMIGLMVMEKLLLINENFFYFSPMKSLFEDKTSKINWGQMFIMLLSSPINNSKLIAETFKLLELVFKAHFFTEYDLFHLYKYIYELGPDNSTKHSVYELFIKLHHSIGYDMIKKLLLNQVLSIDIMIIQKEEIDLIIHLTQLLPNLILFDDLDNILDYIFDLINIRKMSHLIYPFGELINKIDLHTLKNVIKSSVEKLFITLSIESFEDQINILNSLNNLIPKQYEDEIRAIISMILFSKDNNKLSKQLIDYLKVHYSKFNVLAIITSIIQTLKVNTFFSSDLIKALFDIFMISTTTQNLKSVFLQWLKNLHHTKMIILDSYGFLFDLLAKAIALDPKSKVDQEQVTFFWELFIAINHLDSNSLIANNENPLKMKNAFDMWDLIINSQINNNHIGKFIELYALPYVYQNDRQRIWEQMIALIFDHINKDNQENSLIALSLIIDISEYYSTADCKSHALLEESKEITFKVVKSITMLNEKEFYVIIDGNKTLYDLRQMISERIDVNMLCFDICQSNNQSNYYSRKLNGRLIDSLFSNESNTIYLHKSKDANIIIPLQRLTEDPWNYNAQAYIVFTEIFNQFSTNGKMSKEECAKLITKALNTNEIITADSSNVEYTFKFNNINNEYLTLQLFLEYYLETIRESNEDIVWMQLKNLGYRNDLKKITDPLKNEPYPNKDNKAMPKSFLSQNPKYFKVIIGILSNDDINANISDKAKDLIEKIETNELLYNEIYTNLSTQQNILKEKNDKWRLIYTLQIIYLIFDSTTHNNQESICAKGFFLQKDFSPKSSLELVIELFIEQMSDLFNKKEKEHNKMISLYLILLQLIYKALIYLIHDDALNALLKNYVQGCEGEIIKIKTERISVNILSQKNFHLDKIIQVIGKNITLLTNHNSNDSHDIQNKAITLSFQIMLISLLVYDNEKEFNDYLGFNFKDFLLNQLNIQYPYIQRLSFLTFKILFSQNQNDKDFFKTIERMIVKALRSMMIDNDMKKYDPTIIIKVYQDTTKLINYTQKEQKTIISEFIEIAEQTKKCEESVLIGFFTILKGLIESTAESSTDIEKLITILLNKFLMCDENENIIFSSENYLNGLFALLKAIILQSNNNLIKLYSNSKITSLFSYITMINPEKRIYNPTAELKGKMEYIGIKNLSAICYMNSVLQQLYFIKPFSYGINEIQKPSESDNILYQLQRMYSYLELTNRNVYSPEDFVYSYKDITGKPTDIRDQCDAQEFLSRFLEMMENQLKTTHLKYLLSNVFSGESCSQHKCLNPQCKIISNRFEHLYYFSLDIKSSTSLEESLKKYIAEETIDDYICEKCKSKGMLKRVSFNCLPNVLFIHLQRISFNKFFSRNEKINSKLSFPKKLNLKEYCTEQLLDDFNKNDEEYANHVYLRDNDYYKYKLVGAVIHCGTGQSGHYYSLIDVSNRDDDLNEKWMKFNDGNVTEYDEHNLEEDAFGGENIRKGEWVVETNQSAYMLIYERIQKTCLTIVVDEKNTNIKEIIEMNDKIKLNKMIDVNIYHDTKNKRNNDNDKSKYVMMMMKNNQLNDKNAMIIEEEKPLKEFLEIIPYELYCNQISTKDHKHQRIFSDEVFIDNMKLINDTKIYSAPFSELIEVSIIELNKGTSMSEDEIIDLFYKLHDIITSIISKAHIKHNIQAIIDEMIIAMRNRPALIKFLMNDLDLHLEHWLSTFIFVYDSTLGKTFSKYISSILISSIEQNIESCKAHAFIDNLLSYFPKKILSKQNQFVHFFEIIDYLTKSSIDSLKEYFLGKKTIYNLCQIFLGQESPYYRENGITEDNKLTGNFTPVISAIANLLTYNFLYPPSVEERTCIVSPIFCQKAIETNSDMASLCRIIGHFKMLDKTYMIECLKIIFEIVDKSTDYNSIMQSFILVTNLFNQSDDSTLICLENLIGVQQLGWEYGNPCLKFMAPLINGHETIITKMFTWAQQKQFVSFVELFYKLLLINPQVMNYVKNFPTTIGDNIQYGLLKEVRGAYLLVVEQKNMKKDDDYIEKIENIEKLYKQINSELSFESNILGNDSQNKGLAMKRMKIEKEVVFKPQQVKLISLKKICPFLLLKGFYDIVSVSEEDDKKEKMQKAHNYNNQYDNYDSTIITNKFSRYFDQLMTLNQGASFITEDIMNKYNGKAYQIVRYFMLNNINENITVKLLFKDQSINHFPKTEIKLIMPSKSLVEILALPKEYDITQEIVIQEVKPDPIKSKWKNEQSLLKIREDANEQLYSNESKDQNSFKLKPEKHITFNDQTFSSSSVLIPIECPSCGANNTISDNQTEFNCSQCKGLLFQ